MKNPITMYLDWHEDQMFKATCSESITRAGLRGLGVGTVDGLIGIGVYALIIVGIGGIAKLVNKNKNK